MRIDEIINDRNDPDRPLTDRQYQKLRARFFFNLPVVTDDHGNVANPVHPEDKEQFERFLVEAEKRGEISNPTYGI